MNTNLNPVSDSAFPDPASDSAFCTVSDCDTMSDYMTTSVTAVAPLLSLTGLLVLAAAEVQVKVGARALQILLNKDTRRHRKVLLINCAQTVLMLALVYWRLVTPELQALALYTLLGKVVQTNRELVGLDLLGLVSSFTFAFCTSPHSNQSILELVDSLVRLLSVLLPLLLWTLLLLLLPLLLPIIAVAAVGIVGWYCIRSLALVRRLYPEDFDFFITLSISILAWKVVRKEAVQDTMKGLLCRSIQPGDWDRPGMDRVRGWCRGPQRDIVGTIVQVGDDSGFFGDIEKIQRPENSSLLDFYQEIFNNYRMVNIISAVESREGCKLTVSYPPRSGGLRGFLTSSLYRVYIVFSWILPDSYQDYLSVFGFDRSSLVVGSVRDCGLLTKQILLEKINT